MQWVPCFIICCIPFTVGADTEEKTSARVTPGWTPLMFACFDGQTELTKVLIAHGES